MGKEIKLKEDETTLKIGEETYILVKKRNLDLIKMALNELAEKFEKEKEKLTNGKN